MIDDFRPAPRRTESLQENKKNLKVEPTFTTPSQVAADTTSRDPRPLVQSTAAPETAPVIAGRWTRLKQVWPPTKRQALVGIGVFILLGSGIGAALVLTNKAEPVVSKPVVRVEKPVTEPIITTVASALSGLQVDPSLNTKPVIGVMIENSPSARPQSGLAPAGVVYEAVAEGGITRFLALYQDTNPADIGPIRSVRPYYLHWAMGYDAAVAHVGGSPEALANIKSWGTRDLDQFSNSGSYHRVSSRSAPHNVYGAIDGFTQLAQAKGFASSTFTAWARKAEAPSAAPTARSIDMNLSGPTYNVHYDYDAATNSYNRSMAGAPHVDANGSVQIRPKVVIGLVTPFAIQSDRVHSEYGTIGSGQAYIFQDGTVTIGQWNKPDIKAMMTFTDAAGNPLPLNPGQTWLSAVTAPTKITSAP